MSVRLLQRAVEHARARRRHPEAAYRLQFHSGFTFRDAAAVAPYLRDLGITHCYASPYLQARPGSTHGYDITDHGRLNREVGGPEDYEHYVHALHEHGLGQILDTVPNHMGVGQDNPWWVDVLENGPASPYATYFDIAWHASPRPQLQGKVLIPTLGELYGQVLEAGELQLAFDAGAFRVHYYDHNFPLEPGSYAQVLTLAREKLLQQMPEADPAVVEFQSILTAVTHLPPHAETDAAKTAERQREKEVIKRRLGGLAVESPPVRAAIDAAVADFNGKPGEANSFDRLDRLLDQQPYRLSFWRVASDEINYRRFFDVNDLAALSMEREEVFRDTHALTLRLLAEGKLDGLRIDHPDGLFDPRQYLRRLQRHYVLECARFLCEHDPEFRGTDWEEAREELPERLDAAEADGSFGKPLYVVVEKILGAGEPLAEDWPVDGTSGYEFLNLLNGLFVDGGSRQAFTRLYHQWVEDETRFGEAVYQKKLLVLRALLASELYMLAHQLDRLAQRHRRSRDFTLNTLRHALREVIACFPVYRSYTTDAGVREADRPVIEKAVRRAMGRNPTMSRSVFEYVRDMLLLKAPADFDEQDRAEMVRFAGKFQQVTAPVTAKGIEDTAFYTYLRLLSLNEVGGEPDRFGVPPEELHRFLADRQAKWPHALSPLSTHDTKRSEDVRARLNVLSELPDEWRECLSRWSLLNERHRAQVDDLTVPDPNVEYLIYQTLLGAWPVEPCPPEEYEAFVRRIQAYLVKALHEAKVHTSWINPNAEYDQAVQDFAARVLAPEGNEVFLQDFRAFQRRLSHLGMFNSLSQTLLRLTAPGVPDTYQGTELWDFSLVDPDNRRPVDYQRRAELLRQLKDRVASGADRRDLARELLQAKEDGRVKLYVTWQALTCRRENPGLFSSGEYHPAGTTGDRAAHVFGFVRRQGDKVAVVAVPRLLTKLGDVPLRPDVWQDARLLLPTVPPGTRLRNLLTGETLEVQGQDGQGAVPAAALFASFPVALLVRDGAG